EDCIVSILKREVADIAQMERHTGHAARGEIEHRRIAIEPFGSVLVAPLAQYRQPKTGATAHLKNPPRWNGLARLGDAELAIDDNIDEADFVLVGLTGIERLVGVLNAADHHGSRADGIAPTRSMAASPPSRGGMYSLLRSAMLRIDTQRGRKRLSWAGVQPTVRPRQHPTGCPPPRRAVRAPSTGPPGPPRAAADSSRSRC